MAVRDTRLRLNLLKNIYLSHDFIGGFRGGAKEAVAAPFFVYSQNLLRFYFENRCINCSLILSSET